MLSGLSVGFKSAVHCDKQLNARETGKKSYSIFVLYLYMGPLICTPWYETVDLPHIAKGTIDRTH